MRVDRALLDRHGLGLIGLRSGPRCFMLLEALQSTVDLPSYREFYIDLLQEQDA